MFLRCSIDVEEFLKFDKKLMPFDPKIFEEMKLSFNEYYYDAEKYQVEKAEQKIVPFESGTSGVFEIDYLMFNSTDSIVQIYPEFQQQAFPKFVSETTFGENVTNNGFQQFTHQHCFNRQLKNYLEKELVKHNDKDTRQDIQSIYSYENFLEITQELKENKVQLKHLQIERQLIDRNIESQITFRIC
ncbi:UNKNOWN [Stylonychia lemnae]|uniref:Uncharacterized protein n=1 Tax=Stylonychia lemnae TaxID=5949 RepID=A0A078B6W0_STYLE|nr:UNKNOWN [Stylonychia lemnae]|eukprot:CDW90124.1 UNKNOWN [Stylonychia lemnae]